MAKPTRDLLLVKSGGPAVFPEWRDGFAAARPGLAVHEWDEPNIDPEAVTHVLVGHRVHGRIAEFPNVRAIFSGAAGVDHLITDPTLPAHVPIIRMATNENAQTMGEYVCLAALSLLRGWRRIALSQAKGQWDYFMGHRTALTTRIGVMGLGNIGMVVSQMLRGLGFQVSGWSRTPKQIGDMQCFAGMDALPDFLGQLDMVVGLLPHTAETAGLLCARTLAMLPRGAGIVNAGRGSCLVMADLLAALDSGHVSGAVLDVFLEEPLPSDHPAWAHPLITVTPHVAGFATRGARAQYVADGIDLLQRGEPHPYRFIPERGY